MRFRNYTSALEWFIAYKHGRAPRRTESDCISQSYNDELVTAADLEIILSSLPAQQQKALFSLALNGKRETVKRFPTFKHFLGNTVRGFQEALIAAGYITGEPHSADLVAA